ncbi:MAG: hypothetical protein KAI47_19590, partial [Deltaproteobacteria bacterium]|nr:hypothetical protein [Deltaproteobacteria bacterium]
AFVLVRENVARAYSAREALDELAKSPAHLANLLNTDTSRVGVGVVIDRSQSIPLLLITQNFVELPARFVAATADRDARAVLAKARRRAGLGDIVWSPGLAGLARLYLVDYQRLGPKQADGRLGAALRNLGAGYQRVSGMLLAVQAIAGIGGAKELLMPDIAELGLAVVEKRPGRILIFVLVARRR